MGAPLQQVRVWFALSLCSFSLQHKDRVIFSCPIRSSRGWFTALKRSSEALVGAKDMSVRGIIPEGSNSPYCLLLLPLVPAEVPAVPQRAEYLCVCLCCEWLQPVLWAAVLACSTEQNGLSMSQGATSAGGCQVLPATAWCRLENNQNQTFLQKPGLPFIA